MNTQRAFMINELELRVAIDCIEQALEMTVPDTPAHQKNWDTTKGVLEKLREKLEGKQETS